MGQFATHANIDHYLNLLSNNYIPDRNKSVIGKLLVEEENKLSHNAEQLEFAESRAAMYRDRVDRQGRLRECFAAGSTDRAHADSVLVNFEATLHMVEGFCAYCGKRVVAGL
jgi:hypothetical protein